MNGNTPNNARQMVTTTTANGSDERPLCRYFASNICHKGDSCQFSHERNARPDMTCRYYLQGFCAYGSACRYDHVRPNRENANAMTTTTPKSTLNGTFKSNLASQSSTPKSLTSPSLTKAFIPAPPPVTNPWKISSPLENFHRNMGLELELIGGPQQTEEATCSSSSWAQPKMPLPEDIPICPYFEMGICPQGDQCRFVHGLPCDMCGLNVLHPLNEGQRKLHHRECLAEHERQMEAAFAEAKSASMQCGICMEPIVEKGLRFGILQNCSHCYCLECIRKWRSHTDNQINTKTVRGCPECRIHSDYVIPSKVWIDEKAEKEKLIKLFHVNTKKIQCKYIRGGDVDTCHFGNKCFYKHELPDGTVVEGKSPTELRKSRRQCFNFLDFTFPDFDEVDGDSIGAASSIYFEFGMD